MFEISFITSSNEKLAHARHLAKDYDIYISKQKQYGVGYKEPRIIDRDVLLEISIQDALKRWKKTVKKFNDKFFFIEDTSVVIPALSKNGVEYPGTEIKYWMKENNFENIDSQLKKAGNDRTAIVRSDIALVLSLDLQNKLGIPYKRFTSSIKGHITDNEIPLETQPFYSWLSSKTFNKWFIPEGCNKPISLLPIEFADMHDFRAGAFKDMFEFLQFEGVIKRRASIQIKQGQYDFFQSPLFIVCGPSCAGKTTIALYLMNNYGYYHIEASDFMYVSYRERHGVNSSIKIANFAEKALLGNPCTVADQILEYISDIGDTPLVITGFRAIDELNCFRNKYSGRFNIKEIFIEADQNVRYKRSIERNRIDRRESKEDFMHSDSQQQKMGLSILRKEFADSIIENNGTFELYYKSFENKHETQLAEVKKNYLQKNIESKNVASKLEDVIILTLSEYFNNNEWFTTTQIAALVSKKYPRYPKNKNNVSRYFNFKYYPYYDVVLHEDKNKYRLSQTGYHRSEWLKRFYV
ncbi:MAG: non-canonical purine NTP pyrophosphatase [Bacteroidota bacterium]|jgi:dephospho-CoA kinase/inosine/xanthosine triphosphate pyrophosphatase family protein